MQKYHPLLVALHWLMALMILVTLAAGGLVLANMPPDSPDKVKGLAGYIAVGMAIGVLLIVPLITRLRSTQPPHAQTGNELPGQLERWTQWGCYLLIAGMMLSGLATALGLGLFSVVDGGATETLPADLATFAPRVAHGIFSKFLAALIALHIAAALYHQFILKDGLLRRMWFGKRSL